MKEYYRSEVEKGKISEYKHVKRFGSTRELNKERATVKTMKNWIWVIKETKRKSEKLPQDDIRLFFTG